MIQTIFLNKLKQNIKSKEFKRENDLKTSSSYRAVVDYDVDRTGVEAW